MNNVTDFIRHHFNLSEVTQISLVEDDIIVHGVRVGRVHNARDTTLVTLSGTAEVIDLNNYSNLTD